MPPSAKPAQCSPTSIWSPSTDRFKDLACDMGEPDLRTLDTLHLASAVLLGQALTHVVAYDHRLLDAA